MTDFIVGRLKRANWISGHRFEGGKGYILDWTPPGHQRALLLQELIRRHDLTTGSRARSFTASVLESRPSWQGESIPEAEQDFWLICLEELEIGVEENALATVTQLISSWSQYHGPSGSPP